ncbi:MAG: hypothetical protein K8H85_07365 [Cyclobacteriaceae bacterium]|nr:hypothetical protein [Cyclobacteriaceae bacterium]
MKPIIRLSYIVLMLLLVSCGVKKENEALKAEIEKVQKENDAYKAKTVQLTTSIESYKQLLKEIDNNLQAIDANVLMTGTLKDEMKSDASVGEKILNRIKNIHSLMENSKLKLQALDRTLTDLRKKFGDKSEEVQQLSAELKMAAQQLIDREKEFAEMRAGFEDDIEGLESAYQTQLKIAEDLKEMVNRAFYYSGTSNELLTKGIIEKEGGFIGIGKVKVLNANSPEALFNKISKETTDSLVFKSKTLKLITDHPTESFTIKEGKAQSVLKIVDKKAFWKQGNYLVVQTK